MEVEVRKSGRERAGSAPVRILILGAFGDRTGKPVSIDRDNFDDVLRASEVRLGKIQFNELEDFHPDRLYQRLDEFEELRESRVERPAPRDFGRKREANVDEILGSSSLLDQIAEGGRDPLKKYVDDIVKPHLAPAPDPEAPKRESDAAVKMRALLHHPRFQALEAFWRGLDFLVHAVDEDVRISIFNFSKADFAQDLAETSDLKKTILHAVLTSTRWSAVGASYSFGADPMDIELLGRVALLAAHAKAPFLAEGSTEMGPHWPELRSIPEAGWVGLAAPKFLLRWPYGKNGARVEAFPFEEEGHLWGNPMFFAMRLLVSPGEEDLDLSGLPMPCTNASFTEPQVIALMERGLMPLVWFQNSDRVRLAGFRAINSASLPRPR